MAKTSKKHKGTSRAALAAERERNKERIKKLDSRKHGGTSSKVEEEPIKNPKVEKVEEESQGEYMKEDEIVDINKVSSGIIRRVLEHEHMGFLKAKEDLEDENAFTLEDEGFLVAEGDERTVDVSQRDIISEADLGIRANLLDLELSFGPYKLDYTQDGRYMLLGGKKGELGLVDCQTYDLVSQVNVLEEVKAVKFCHSEEFWATAQKKYVHIYDKKATELHSLAPQPFPCSLEYLPLHFLLAHGSENGNLTYRDISTGNVVVTHRTRKGPVNIMQKNPWNAVINVGHNDGTVTLWSPTVEEPLVKLPAHARAITALCPFGNWYLATAALDKTWRVFDMRNSTKEMAVYKYKCSPPSCINANSRGDMICMGLEYQAEVWRGLTSESPPTVPYLKHTVRSKISSVIFRPYEDILSIGHESGITNTIIPGAGNSSVHGENPYASAKQRRNRTVKELLDKLPPETITLDPTKFGSVIST